MKKAFTLIEILIYSFLLALTMTLIFGILTNFFFFRGVYLTKSKVAKSLPYLLEEMAREIREANSIIYPLPGNSTSTLFLLDKENRNLVFEIENDQIIEKIEEKSFPLTPKELKIKSLEFFHSKRLPEGASLIKIKLEIEYQNPLKLREYEFFTTYYLSVTKRK